MGDKHLVTIEMDRERHQFVITGDALEAVMDTTLVLKYRACMS